MIAGKSGLWFWAMLVGVLYGADLLGLVARPVEAQDDAKQSSLLKRFDKDGDGKISDEERREVRATVRRMGAKPGAMTPSGKTETVGDREITELDYASSDGRKIPCVLSMPKGDGPFPILVTIHGGQGNRDLGYLRTMAAPNKLSPTIDAFNRQPWAILAISYRADNGALFGKEQDDVVAGIRFAKTLPKIDPARVGVVGGSHGGHLALIAAEKMGNEFLCVAAAAPWMTNPVAVMTGDPDKPPMSFVPEPARSQLVKQGKSLYRGLTVSRGLSEPQAGDFLEKHSIEANSGKIVMPTLFITSRGDDQAPHALIEPMIRQMKAAKQDVSVYTAERSPHGFYWARTVSAARALRGSKSDVEADEERIARETMLAFFTKQFSRADIKVVGSPKEGTATQPVSPAQQLPSDGGRAVTLRGAPTFGSLVDTSGAITRERFLQEFGKRSALSNRPDVADRLFSRLDSDGNGSLDEAEFGQFAQMRERFTGSRGQSLVSNRTSDRVPETGSRRERAPKPNQANSGKEETSQVSETPPLVSTSKRSQPVRIDTGLVVGERKDGVQVFRGIPYAAPPIGDLRWKAPERPSPWTGVRDALEFGPSAPQGETFYARSQQSENCLTLNVWAPEKKDLGRPVPVLVWFHGGAFIQGSGAQPRYDGSELAKRGVVVVTVNYRLGPLGLFAHPTLTASAKADDPLANYCLLDMMESLRWVARNIAAFGGDPRNVTISGSSAGATSCLFLMGIPAAKDLFHKAIVQSSGGMSNIQDLAKAESAGLRLADHLGLESGSMGALRGVDANRVALSVAAIRKLDLPVKPVVDGRLVTATVEQTFARGQQHRIPVLIGACNGESGGRRLDDFAISGAFGFQLRLASDMQRVGQDVFLFQFTFVPEVARANRPTAKHGEAVAYSFGTHRMPIGAQYGFRDIRGPANAVGARSRGGGGADDSGGDPDASADGDKVSQAMMDYWVAFMRTGKPAAPDRPEWPSFNPSKPNAMVFGTEGAKDRNFRMP